MRKRERERAMVVLRDHHSSPAPPSASERESEAGTEKGGECVLVRERDVSTSAFSRATFCKGEDRFEYCSSTTGGP